MRLESELASVGAEVLVARRDPVEWTGVRKAFAAWFKANGAPGYETELRVDPWPAAGLTELEQKVWFTRVRMTLDHAPSRDVAADQLRRLIKEFALTQAAGRDPDPGPQPEQRPPLPADHVDFRLGTFHDRVVGVQHNHYGAVPAPAEWRPVAQVGWREFGVHPTGPVPGLADVPPYVPRDCDEDLRAKLAGTSLVLILGEPYAGKSYTAWHGVRALEDHRLYAPDPGEDLRPLLAALRSEPGKYVVWLDELTDHLGPGRLDLRLLGRLNEQGAVVLGTMRPAEYYRRRAGSAPGDRVVAAARTVELAREWSEDELARLSAHDDPRAYPAYMWSGREGAASYFAVGHLLFDEWRRVGTQLEHPGGQLLVRAAVDLARCGVTGAVPAELLRSVQEHYGAQERESFEDALAWATAPMFGVSGLLVAGEGDSTWRAYGALVAEALRSGDLEPVPDAVWWTLLDAAENGAPLDRGVILGAARAALRSRVEAGDAEVLFSLAIRTEGEEGASLLHRAADAGHAEAAGEVARHLLLIDGDEQVALPYLEVAAESGDSWAALQLGRIHRDHAERWLRTAAEAGEGAAAHELGDMLVGPGREDEALRWYRKAAAAGHREVAGSLGNLLYYWHEREAEDWLRYAAAWGDARAVNCLGVYLDTEKDADETEKEPLYRQAAEGGDPSAAVNLGEALENLGRDEEALSWYLKGHERGAVYAELRLAELLRKQGKDAEAEEWFRRAASLDPEGVPASLPAPPGHTPTGDPDTVEE
ncbi:tetratricopeptide repeat protein [Streptomyces sp. NPDC101165]|uniref:tetratricopeptide repeat protein n=1 Tax=Streptomyces sp. NPDC101165 TaxID=3366119 RepID=UPI00380CEAC6